MAQLGAIVGVSLLAYMAAVWAAGKLLGLSEGRLLHSVWGALTAIGVIAAGVIALVENAPAGSCGFVFRHAHGSQR